MYIIIYCDVNGGFARGNYLQRNGVSMRRVLYIPLRAYSTNLENSPFRKPPPTPLLYFAVHFEPTLQFKNSFGLWM